MLTYQLQERFFKIERGKKFVFPNEFEIEVCLEPSEQFGIGTNFGRTIRQDTKCNTFLDANTGRCYGRSESPLEAIDVTLEGSNTLLKMHGNVLIAKGKCKNLRDLLQVLQSIHYGIAIILNLELGEPPVVKYTRGRIGNVNFQWIMGNTLYEFFVTTHKMQNQHVLDSFLRLNLFGETKNRRLLAGLYYFYVARRLVEAGNSPYEFLSEVVLNLCKTLEVLFGHSRDNVRTELMKLGYTNEEIEERFIPLMILRNDLDVGHVSLKVFKQNQLNIIHQYLTLSERDYREMLKRLVTKIGDGSYTPMQDTPIILKNKDFKKINRLLTTLENRIKKSPHYNS